MSIGADEPGIAGTQPTQGNFLDGQLNGEPVRRQQDGIRALSGIGHLPTLATAPAAGAAEPANAGQMIRI